MATLRARFGEVADVERPLLAGFSLGATEAAFLAQAEPRTFPRLAMLEGGVDNWPTPPASAYAAAGGLRVLFGCRSAWCTPAARAASARIDAEGVGSHVAWADVGHRNAPELIAAIRAELPWLAEGDERWRAEDQCARRRSARHARPSPKSAPTCEPLAGAAAMDPHP